MLVVVITNVNPHTCALRRPAVSVVAGALALAFLSNAHAFGAAESRIGDPPLLVSRAADGGVPNAPAADAVISQDARTAVAIAYVSKATNISGGSTGGMRNVYLVSRKKPYDANANTPWTAGGTVLASRGKRTPNGDSWGPSLSGGDNVAASCLAFISSASNLVPGDNDHRADIFVRPLHRNRLTRIAGTGSVTSVSVDGACKKIAYTSGKGVFIVTLRGGTQQIARGSAGNVTINSWDSNVSFQRGNAVYLWQRGSGLRRIDSGTNPKLSLNAKVLAYERGGSVRSFSLITRKTRTLGPGADPAPTVSGVFIFWVRGNLIVATGIGRSVARCAGGPQSPETSAHGNYLIYLCAPSGAAATDRQVHLEYIGGK